MGSNPTESTPGGPHRGSPRVPTLASVTPPINGADPTSLHGVAFHSYFTAPRWQSLVTQPPAERHRRRFKSDPWLFSMTEENEDEPTLTRLVTEILEEKREEYREMGAVD